MSKTNFEDFLSAMNALKEAGKNFVAVTLVKQVGSSPQDVGARALVSSDGLEYGTVGGGKVENRAIQEAKKMIADKTRYQYADWNLQKDIGMTCGGVVGFFFELFEKEHPFHVAVFGAGHIAQEFIPLLLKLDCKVTCFDSRPEWINRLPSSPKLTTLCTENLAEQVAKLPPRSFVAIMTMGHGTDLPILIETMKQRERFSYVGNIGSDLKYLRLKKDLQQAGISEDTIQQFHCPMGENFGGNSPIEIAFSIVAQLLKTKDQIFANTETLA
ncbi:xanthine dehydrogenase accessory protein XdhC [Bdellovibrio sp. 22V]|uniref:xanthine dehydrogenase accessory protein XdhC n=1 Tax=Bdellovibrio sp. 22V TaxID=3044166 RepID=UPI002543DCA9|nr:xanthine dehydrogenase accessory protein XdhC [Bdellovibrio sp. 22V]WII73295.1 xanthine dehydrogenase accessory protein XdhC [Bdellovibrio sp. 22V]